MTPDVSIYGLSFPELVLFGILLYLAALTLVICFARCLRHRVLCPFSEGPVHCTYTNQPCVCPNCSLRQCARSVFCCRRKHSIYCAEGCQLPACKFRCFKPDCEYLRCFCCEFSTEKEEAEIFSVETSSVNKIELI